MFALYGSPVRSILPAFASAFPPDQPPWKGGGSGIARRYVTGEYRVPVWSPAGDAADRQAVPRQIRGSERVMLKRIRLLLRQRRRHMRDSQADTDMSLAERRASNRRQFQP